jgi:DNA (cytosine-5)-methyltransferase 1
MTVGSLFSGIGGFDLGFERAGFEIKWQVEIDDYASAVLAQHWPGVRRYRDVRTVTDLETVDVICGGFPCQPHSLAGKRAGSSDERDLWPSFARLIRECQPRWVVAENVPGLLSSDAGRFFGSVLGDLAACGYDAEWDCLPAAAFGAPHRRDRVWIVAYPHATGRGEYSGAGTVQAQQSAAKYGRHAVADADRDDQHGRRGDVQMGRIWGAGETADYGDISRAQWRSEPDVGRVAHGVSARVDRLKGLGNAIVPQIAEWIARQIVRAEQGHACA